MGCCRYTVKIGKFYLAPNPSIQVIEADDFETFDTGSDQEKCSTCSGTTASQVNKREVTLKLRYKGQGSLVTAWSIYNKLEAVLGAGCATKKQIGFYRRVCDEPALTYNIRRATQRMIETWSQRTRQRVLTIELKLVLAPYNSDKLFDFGDGPFAVSYS